MPRYGELKQQTVKQADSTVKSDPAPDTRIVRQFHTHAEVDVRAESIHHTLGSSPYQAASGSHKHDGSDSPLLLTGVSITGAKGGNTALASVINVLVQMGATDNTTA